MVLAAGLLRIPGTLGTIMQCISYRGPPRPSPRDASPALPPPPPPPPPPPLPLLLPEVMRICSAQARTWPPPSSPLPPDDDDAVAIVPRLPNRVSDPVVVVVVVVVVVLTEPIVVAAEAEVVAAGGAVYEWRRTGRNASSPDDDRGSCSSSCDSCRSGMREAAPVMRRLAWPFYIHETTMLAQVQKMAGCGGGAVEGGKQQQ